MPDTSTSSDSGPGNQPSRRSLLGWTAALAAAIGAMVAVPVASLFAAPLLRRSPKAKPGIREGQWVPIGKAEEFDEAGRTQSYEFDYQDGWYTARRTGRVMVRKQGSDFVVLSTVCTHVSCSVNWVPEQKQFFCPCHAGVFDAEGKVVSGPPPRPLQRYETQVNAATGQLEIRES